jgi:hypothetical protein
MLALLLTIGCNVPKHYASWDAQLAYAAHDRLAAAVDKIDKISRSDRVAIVNLDHGPGEDQEVVPYVEDALVHAVTQAGATVVERDSQALRALVQEGSGDKLDYTVTGRSEGPEKAMVYDATLSSVGSTSYLVNGSTEVFVAPGTTLLDVGPDGGDDTRTATASSTLSSDVMSANKVLAYRVVDVEVRSYTYKGEVYRFSTIVLHMRVIDAAYGTVLWSGMVEEVVEDKVPVAAATKLRR